MHKTFQSATVLAIAVLVLATGASAKMSIKSSAFAAGTSIPSKYTCDNGPSAPNPPLRFAGVPANAKSLVLIVEDIDVPKTMIPTGVFDHWMVWDIAPDSKGIKEGDGAQGLNGTGKPGYYGPCPPDREHRYFFHLYALDEKIGDAKIANRKDLEDAMKGHIIEQTELMGKYNKIKK